MMKKPRRNPTRRKQQLTAILANGPLTLDEVSRQMRLAKQSVQQYLRYYSDDFEQVTQEGKKVWSIKRQ